jgi:hypothetical protein
MINTCFAAQNGGCFCTGRCQYTKEEWESLEEIKKQFNFTGVQETKNKVTSESEIKGLIKTGDLIC